jgi:hypothetical protein
MVDRVRDGRGDANHGDFPDTFYAERVHMRILPSTNSTSMTGGDEAAYSPAAHDVAPRGVVDRVAGGIETDPVADLRAEPLLDCNAELAEDPDLRSEVVKE